MQGQSIGVYIKQILTYSRLGRIVQVAFKGTVPYPYGSSIGLGIKKKSVSKLRLGRYLWQVVEIQI
jgi:hypothetical protein